jgi:4-amino-4-deoxy-L-arabinose transferase-like glycosyltransferase
VLGFCTLARHRLATLLEKVEDRPVASLAASREVLTQSLVAVSLGMIAYLFGQILMFRYGRDQGIYATVADTVLRGGMPYRDAWDFKPPGIYVVYAIARAVFGSRQWGIRLVEVAGLASVVGAFVILSRRFFSDWRIGILGGALAVLVHAELEFWHTAQPESFGGILTAWALVLATFEPDESDPVARSKQLNAWVFAGAFYGAAFLMKPPLGGGALVSAIFAGFRVRQKSGARPLKVQWRQLVAPLLSMAVGSAMVLLVCAVWFVVRGAAHDLFQTLFVFTPHYTKLSWEDATVPGMLYLAIEEWFVDLSSANAVGVLAALLLAPIAAREREGVLHVLAVVAVQLVGVAMQGKFFPYHYGASLLLGAFLAGLGAYKLWQRALARSWPGVIAFAALVPVAMFARSATRNTQTDFLDRCVARHRQLLRLSKTTSDELDGKLYSVADVSFGADRSVAELLRARLAPEETTFIWGFEPMIYDMSGRRPATRFIYDVPQRVAWFRDEARATLMTDLEAHPPKAIVVEHRDVFPAVTGDSIDSADTLQTFPALAAFLQNRYAMETTIEDFDVYFAR